MKRETDRENLIELEREIKSEREREKVREK
jgi:hypothetical protein